MITEADWEAKFEEAKQFMQSRSEISRVLIEVSSQHPLRDGLYPGEEFEARLKIGLDLYKKSTTEGLGAESFVPGSRHRIAEVADLISLTDSGTNFLIENGMDPNVLHGQDLIDRYKKDEGIYSSADEAFVAASYFKDSDFGRLYSVVSPFQLTRKSLHYIWSGVLPLFYTAPTLNAFHNPLGEVYYVLPYVRDIDPDWQGAESVRGNKSRAERTPLD